MKRYFHFSYLALIYLFLYLPIVVLIVYSFNQTTFSAVWHGFTLKWYQTLFQDQSVLLVAEHSLVLAVAAATIAMIVGAVGAVALFRYRFLGKNLLNSSIFILIVVPDLVFGISLLILYSLFNIPLGFWTLLLAHVTFCLPFVVVTILGRLSGTDKNIFEAAKDLGANEFQIFIRIIVPLILPALIAGWLLSFTLSLDDVIISFFVSGPSYQILPLYIYSLVHVGVTPEINALCTLMFALTILIAIFLQGLLRIKE